MKREQSEEMLLRDKEARGQKSALEVDFHSKVHLGAALRVRRLF
jgi:hypothetical protein